MAKGTAYCTCKTCGDKFTRTSTNCGNRKQATEWENWAEENYNLCSKCYAKELQELEIKKGLYVNVRISGSIYDINLPIAIIFEGDTKPHKETIKSLGAKWIQNYPVEGIVQ